jgi:hypothetical protein
MRALVAVASVFLVAACGGADTAGSASTGTGSSSSATSVPRHLADDSTITYKLRDASVPPEFHRSVTVTVTKAKTNIVIDSYGDVLADETADTPQEVWAMLDTGLYEAIQMSAPEDPKGCTGGTGRELAVQTGGKTVVDFSAEFCGGSNSGLDTRIDAWILPARALFPTTDVLAPTG